MNDDDERAVQELKTPPNFHGWEESDPEFIAELKRRVEMVRSGDYESVSFEECRAAMRKALIESRQ